MKHLSGACTLMVLLAACTSKEPPTVTRTDIERAFDAAEDAAALPVTPVSRIPTGFVTYDGKIGADVTGDSLGSVLADMTMRVDFQDNRIGGRVDNINLIDQNGEPDQRLLGSLEIAGFENNGNLDAGASGQVTAVGTNNNQLDAQMNLDLDGTVRSDRSHGDTVYGGVTGDARGDFNLDVDGVFYGERR